MACKQPEDAERALFGVLALVPDCAEANRLMGIHVQMHGNHAEEVEFPQQVLAVRPDATAT
ncbi:hypothetical protein [Rhodanobacter geophilus]|uniref:Uncharacterized protein n=1 Tax=Rhodanobacter geophilus TaxID=3162488 RepID=A0ABV3QJA5_9GAMM